MKLITILMAALFPFLHATTYHAELISCKPNEIKIVSEGSRLELTLFNTKITNEEKGWATTCALLEDADVITFEIDPSSKVEDPVSAYVFADGKLVQEELIAQGFAYPMIHNPEYTYEKRLEEANHSVETMAKPQVHKEEKEYPLQGPLFLGGCLLIWLACLLYFLRKRRGHAHKERKAQ